MGQILHGSATTTHAIRAAIQRSKATAKALAERHGLNPKTVANKKRAFVHDAPLGPKDPRLTVLSIEEEAIVVAFRKHTLLPLDDCLYAIRLPSDTLPVHRFTAAISATRSAGCRKSKATSLPKKLSKSTLSAISTSILPGSELTKGNLYLFVAVDRTSKFAFAQLHDKAGKLVAAQFLRDLIDAVPYKIHTVLTDNGIQFVNRKRDSNALEHIFGRTCREIFH